MPPKSPPHNPPGHYADAGEAAALMSLTLGADMVLTGHSLGRNKLEHLLKSRECRGHTTPHTQPACSLPPCPPPQTKHPPNLPHRTPPPPTPPPPPITATARHHDAARD
jgi:hypothetical protein